MMLTTFMIGLHMLLLSHYLVTFMPILEVMCIFLEIQHIIFHIRIGFGYSSVHYIDKIDISL